jgi:hypothetical protein
MQLTTLTVLLATALTVSASPFTEKRQTGGTPRVYARFWNTNSCSPPEAWAEDTVFIQSDTVGLAGCQNLTVGPFASTQFDTNNFSRTGEFALWKGRRLEEQEIWLTGPTVRFFNVPCNQLTSINSGNFVDVKPGQAPVCQALPIRSWITL